MREIIVECFNCKFKFKVPLDEKNVNSYGDYRLEAECLNCGSKMRGRSHIAPSFLMEPGSCKHNPSGLKIQVVLLYRRFPSQGDVGYQHNCTKCGAWLICDCKKEFYMTYLPHYIDEFNQGDWNSISIPIIEFYPNVCLACRNNDESVKREWEKFKKVIEHIYSNDKDLFDYCYGNHVSGYEKDMKIRHEAESKDEALKAKIRQGKARQLLNNYLFMKEG